MSPTLTFPPSPKKLTIDALADIQIPQEVQISRSGEQVVYTLTAQTKKLDKEFVSSIWIADVGKEGSARQITAGLRNDKSPKWSPDGEYVAFLSDRGGKAGEVSAVWVLGVRGGEAWAITRVESKKTISSFEWSPNGKFIAFISADEKSPEKQAKEKEKDDAKVYGEDWEYARLRYVHVATREISTLFDGDAHVTKFAWGQDSSSIVFVVHQTPDINSPMYFGVEFRTISLSKKEYTVLAKFPGAVGDIACVGADKDNGGTIYFTAGTTADSICTSTTVYELEHSLQSENKITRVGFGEENCAQDLRTSKVSQDVFVRVQEGLSDQLHKISGSTLGVMAVLHDGMYELSSWDVAQVNGGNESDSQKIFMSFGKSEGDRPTEIFSKVDGEIVQLSNHGSAIADLHVMDVTPIYCNAKDGTKIDAVFYTPTGSEKKDLPTVVVIHGGPYWRSSTSFDSSSFHWAPWLVSAGYAVLCPNYRGGSGYGETFASAIKGAIGTKDYDDVVSLVNEGISLGYMDKERVAVGGWSQGGYLSYLAVTRPDFKFKAAICGAGISDWDTMSLASDVPSIESQLVGGTPWENDYKKTESRYGSPIWHMKNAKTPILMLHGADDVRVPLVNAVGFHRGCLHYGIPCEFVVYPREGHPIYERQHRVDILKRIRRFIDLHLA